MTRNILSFIFIGSSFLWANDTTKLYTLYNQGHYEEACHTGFSLFSKNRKNEAFVSLYGYACLNSDYLDRLATPIVMLKYSADARANAAYFSAILMKKKLLYHALLDDYALEGIHLPASSHVLSKVFDLFAARAEKTKQNTYIFNDPIEEKITYHLYLDQSENVPKIIIEVYQESILKKRHIYW